MDMQILEAEEGGRERACVRACMRACVHDLFYFRFVSLFVCLFVRSFTCLFKLQHTKQCQLLKSLIQQTIIYKS